jgi:NtrC-family two-component system sensor histidine kinase KinB
LRLIRPTRDPIFLPALRRADDQLLIPPPLMDLALDRGAQADFAALLASAQELQEARMTMRASLEAVAKEEARQRALLGALREAILATSADGQVDDFNPAAAALFGDPGRLKGRHVTELLPFVRPATEASSQDVLWQGTIVEAAGHSLDVEVSQTALLEGTLPLNYVYVIHDISRYAEVNRLREQLLHNVAHELRAPLGVLDNALEILATDYGELPASELDELMRTARRTTRRLRALMEDLLSAGSIQSGRFQIRARPTPPSAFIDDALEMVEAMLEPRAQRIDLHADASLPEVMADPLRARQVLTNLLHNASKYSADGDVIGVRTEHLDGHVRISVADRGVGIPEDQQAGLFERFYRVRPGNEEPGIGLGLAICKGIVEAHGGTIGVESLPGSGTTVWFTLPVAPDNEEEWETDEDSDRG